MAGSSLAIMVLQLAYAAVTSRLLPPSAFGAYAVGLSGIGLLSMVAGSSLGLSAARRDHESIAADRALVTIAVVVGLMATGLAVALAPVWSRMWAVPESVTTTRVLALSMSLASVSEVLAGIHRRGGATALVAIRAAVGQLLGMGVGLAVILVTRAGWSLAVAAVVGATCRLLLLGAPLPMSRVKPGPVGRAAAAEAVYGAKVAGMNVLRSLAGQVSIWSMSRFSGAPALGAYNRASTLITIPLETIQRAFNYSLFPELRPGGPVFANPRALTDILVVVTWPTLIVASLGYLAAPPFLTLLLGPGWEEAARLGGVAVWLGALPMVGVPVGAAVEALGLFRVSGRAWALGILPVAAGVIATAASGDPMNAMAGLLCSALVGILVGGAALDRSGLIQRRRYAQSVVPLALIQAGLVVVVGLGLDLMSAGSLSALLAVASIAAAELLVLWAIRRRTPLAAIAGTRGLPGFRT